MLLSYIEQLGTVSVPHAYGVLVDRLGERPPVGLKEVGFVATATTTDDLEIDVLDTAILYRLHGLRVLLEIQPHLRMEANTIIRTCANIGCDIVLLPPDSGLHEDWDQYRRTLIAYTQTWLKVRGNQTALYPSSGYLQYLFGASIGYRPDSTFMTSDPYLGEHFVDGLPQEEIDLTKLALDPIFLDHFGGEQGVRLFMNTVGSGIFTKLRALESAQTPPQPPP